MQLMSGHFNQISKAQEAVELAVWQWITKVSGILPLGSINACTIIHGNWFNCCWDTAAKWWTGYLALPSLKPCSYMAEGILGNDKYPSLRLLLLLTFITGRWFSSIVSLINSSWLTVGAVTGGANRQWKLTDMYISILAHICLISGIFKCVIFFFSTNLYVELLLTSTPHPQSYIFHTLGHPAHVDWERWLHCGWW